MKLLLVSISLISVSCSSIKNTSKSNFSKIEIALISNAEVSDPMRIYKINNKSDSILLRSRSSYIKPDIDDKIQQKFIKRLLATVKDSSSMGVGIAAPQVGILKNIIWVQRFDKENFPFEVYLNPTIVHYSNEKQTFREGCLSIPDRTDTLSNRSKTISIEYDTKEGLHRQENVEGFTSVIFQHEIDHLNGILYLDHLNKDIIRTN